VIREVGTATCSPGELRASLVGAPAPAGPPAPAGARA